MVPKSVQNPPKNDHSYKYRFDFDLWSIFDNFFGNLSNVRTLKIFKNPRVFSIFDIFGNAQHYFDSHPDIHLTWCLFGTQNRPKSHPKPPKNQHPFFKRLLVQFWVALGPILGPIWIVLGQFLVPKTSDPANEFSIKLPFAGIFAFGTILGPFWDHFGTILGTVLGPFLGPFWDRFVIQLD